MIPQEQLYMQLEGGRGRGRSEIQGRRGRSVKIHEWRRWDIILPVNEMKVQWRRERLSERGRREKGEGVVEQQERIPYPKDGGGGGGVVSK